MPLEDYREHFEEWLKDLKKTGGYWPIVKRHNYNWRNIYFDLNQLFKDEVWCWNREQENVDILDQHNGIRTNQEYRNGRVPRNRNARCSSKSKRPSSQI